MNPEKTIDVWNECIIRMLGIPWGFLIGVELTIAQSCISLVNKIQTPSSLCFTIIVLLPISTIYSDL
jgi:hypothetical protein